MQHKVERADALGHALAEVSEPGIDDRFAALEREEEVERLLEAIKAGRSLTA